MALARKAFAPGETAFANPADGEVSMKCCLSWRRALHSALLGVAAIAAACRDETPTTPQPLERSGSVASVAVVSSTPVPIAEEIVLAPQFQSGAPNRLASVVRAIGTSVELTGEQAFEADTREYTLQLRVKNLGADMLWRPLRVEVVGLFPQSPTPVVVVGADNNRAAAGAVWDYGQSLGPLGRLEPAAMSDPRRVRIRVPWVNESGLHALIVRLRITGVSGTPHTIPSLARDATDEEGQRGYARGVVLVRYASSQSDTDLARLNTRYDLAGQDFIPAAGAYVAFLREDSFEAVSPIVDRLKVDPQVAAVAPAAVGRLVGDPLPIPDASEVGVALHMGRFEAAWAADAILLREPGQGVTVGVIDTGIGAGTTKQIPTQDILSARDGRCQATILGLPERPTDEVGHGTAVASVVNGRFDGVSPVGGAFGARVQSIKASNSESLFPWDIRCSLDLMATLPRATIVNMSFGGPGLGSEVLRINELLVDLFLTGRLLVAAAGNDLQAHADWPASALGVLAVSGTDDKAGDALAVDGPANGSNWGPEIDFSAPYYISTAALDGFVLRSRGTSFAAPQLAAMAAIVQSRFPQLRGAALEAELRRYVVDIGASGRDPLFGEGRITFRAVSISPKPVRLTLPVENVKEVTVSLDPAGPPVPEVKWRLKDDEIAWISKTTGTSTTIHGVKKGETYLIAETQVTRDSVLVTVNNAVTPPPPDPPPPPPDPVAGSGGCGGTTWGDPHLITIDGLTYDFQASGDYILSKSTDPNDDFEIQVRYVPGGAFSYSGAVAARVHGDIVNVFPASGSSGPRIVINGQSLAGTDGLSVSLPGGGAVSVTQGYHQYTKSSVLWATITWPDRTMLKVFPSSDWRNYVQVFLAPPRLGKVQGLLGNFDGDVTNDLRIRNGAVINAGVSELYGDFRSSWRVALGSTQSLFVQGPDYWNSVPPTALGVGDLDPAQAVRAQTVCTNAGVILPSLLAACMVDVVLTGDDNAALSTVQVDPALVTVTVSPEIKYLLTGQSEQFAAVVSGTTNKSVSWSATGGTIAATAANSMTYSAPATPGTYKITAVSAVNAVPASATVVVTPPSTATFDPAAQLSSTNNPNGTWSYGWSAPVTTLAGRLGFQLFTRVQSYVSGIAWSTTASLFPFVGTGPSGSINLHSGCGGEWSVLRWTAPASGVYIIRSQFFNGDSGETEAWIFKNGSLANTLFHTAATSSNPSFSLSLSATLGETIDVVVGPGTDGCSGDTTPLSMTISAGAP
jgi:hypothetical protein